MGNAQVPRVDEPRASLAQNPSYQGLAYQDVLGSYKLFKVMRCVHESEGDVVVKLFLHRDGQPELKEVQHRIQQVKDALRSTWLRPNVLPYQAMVISQSSSILVRQHFLRNLNDRLHTRPFLSMLEKKWLAFQVVAGVCQAHSAGVVHGDLKTENIFVSSWNHAIITDFATFKPLMLPQDDPTEFSFFFESDRNRHRCYLAPERFECTGAVASLARGRFSRELAAMDIFSLGCVLAEVFLDGQTLLDLPQLRAFRGGELDLGEKLSALSAETQEMLLPMLARDPSQRKSGIQSLRDWCHHFFPKSFCSCFFPLLVLLLHPMYQQPDMRVALLRANFAAIVWLLAGSRTIEGRVGAADSRTAVWQAWRMHVEQRASDLDAVLPSIATASLQAASMLESEVVESPSHSPVAACDVDGDIALAQPLLEEDACCEFTSAVFDAWDAGFKSCASSGQIEEGESQDHTPYVNLLTRLCSARSRSGSSPPPPPGSGDEPGDSVEESLGILCGLIGSCAQLALSPRCRLACIEMMELLVPFSSQEMLLEQVVPYSHVLMVDGVAKVRAKALHVLCGALGAVTQLPASHAGLFVEYIFPQLTSMMSGMNNEPIVLLAVAQNLGVLATESLRFAELAVAARPATQAGNTPKGEATAPSVQVEKFDVQVKQLQEAIRKVWEALQDFLNMQSATPEETLMAHTMSREVKIALLRNSTALSDAFGREGTHNFLLPYMITFMNDPAWEVRAALCDEAAKLPLRVGQVTSEGIIWPCYDVALLDQEERVVEAALRGLKVLVSQAGLRRAMLVTVTKKVTPLLVHPSELLRSYSAEVVKSLADRLSELDQYVFLLPEVQPYLLPECGLGSISSVLVTPLGRLSFKSVVLRRADALHDALVSQQPLPEGDEAENRLWELMRPYLRPLLSARASKAAGQRDDVAWHTLQATKVQSIQYATVNPHLSASKSLAARSEANSTSYHTWLPLMPRGVWHPLGYVSLQAYLVKAFCLPPKACDLGSLSSLDGTPFSLYAPSPSPTLTSTSVNTVRHELVGLEHAGTFLPDSRAAGAQDGADFSMGSVVASVLVSASSDKAASSTAPVFRGLWPRYDSGGTPDAEAAGASRLGAQQATWRPKGQLLATLYEYAHQSGVPVVKTDVTDDSRLLVTGGADGVVKIWSCAQLESDVAPSASCSVSLPSRDAGSKRQVLRALRTVRNSKAFAAGTNAGEVLLYKVESAGAKLVQAARYRSPSSQALPQTVTCIEQFDTELESMVVFAQDSGEVLGWDVRCASAWSLQRVPPALGVPSSIALGGDGHSATVATLGGGLIVYDLRFLRPWKNWKVSTGAGILSMRPADFASSPGVFAAIGSKMNEVALYDVTNGSCLTLFLTDPVGEKPKEDALGIPTLLELPVVAGVPQVTWDNSAPLLSGSRLGTGGVRSLWLPPRGAQTFLLTAGSDRKVRHWSLDPGQTSQDCSIVTPPDFPGETERPTYTASHLGDVFVVQEHGGQSNEVPASLSQRAGSQASSSPSPNHRDAILDLCTISLQHDILVTAGRDGLIKLWR